MKISNLTKNKIIFDNAIVASGLKEKLFGLILHSKPTAMVFHTRFGIHTFFMKYPIDVLVLNNQNRVAAFKKNLKSNRIFIWNPAYSLIIELPPGTIEKTGTKLGDNLLI